MIAASDNAGIKGTQLPRFLSFLFPPRDVISWSLLSSGLACLPALPNARSCTLLFSACYRMFLCLDSVSFALLICAYYRDSLLSGWCFPPYPISRWSFYPFFLVSFPSIFPSCHNLRGCGFFCLVIQLFLRVPHSLRLTRLCSYESV